MGTNKKYIRIIPILIVGVTVCSCSASTVMAPRLKDLDAKKFETRPYESNIYVYRPSSMYQMGMLYTVALDDETAGALASDTYFLFKVEPGKHTVTSYFIVGGSVAPKSRADSVDIVVEVGKNYFVKMTPRLIFEGWVAKGYGALQRIAYESEGQSDVNKTSLAFTASTEYGDSRDERAPLLHRASLIGDEEKVRFLLDGGDDINLLSGKARTALMYAAQGGSMAVLRLLLEKGISVSARDKSGFTALHFAAFSGHTTIARMLVEHGANVNIVSRLGSPVYAAAVNGQMDVVRELLRQGGVYEIRKGTTEEILYTALLQRASADEFIYSMNKDEAVQQLQASNSNFARTVFEFRTVAVEQSKEALYRRSMSEIHSFLGSVGPVLSAAGQSYTARNQARQWGEIMALRDARTISQYFTYNRMYQNSIRTKPIYYPSPSGSVSKKWASEAAYLEVAYDAMAKINERRVVITRALQKDGEKILECLQGKGGAALLTCYNPVTF